MTTSLVNLNRYVNHSPKRKFLLTQVIRHLPVNETPANLKQTQVTSLAAVNPVALSILDSPRAKGDQPDIEQSDGQRQAGQMQEPPQVGAFQITKGFFNSTITNDKFCMSRTVRLRLVWWRRALQSRPATGDKSAYPSDEPARRGGMHETPVENTP
jgi:hypothetical protein